VVQAYLLVQTLPGQAGHVAQAIRAMVEGVTADTVTGPYDVVAVLEAATLDELARLVLERIQKLPGITRTLTCPVVSLPG
jgi:DNA-binding Lrp family transcriptional regulator